MCVNVTRCRATAAIWNVAALAQKRCYQFQLSERTQSVRSAIDVDLAMHSVDTVGAQHFGTNLSDVPPVAPIIEPCFQFTPEQKASAGQQPYISDLVTSKTARGEFFYGIEITGQSKGKPTCVDFNGFLPVLPTFISIVWLPQYWNVMPIERVETLQLIRNLETHIPAMPHLSLFRQTKERIDEFLALNFRNMLAVRGDKTHEDQVYRYSHQLVEHARRVRGVNISIAVAGHPQGYAGGPQGLAESIEMLKKKIDNGADFIITQLCYSPETIVEFLRGARNAGIQTPIMVGVVVPDSFKSYALIEMISKISLPAEARAEVEKYQNDDAKVKSYFVQLALRTIQQVLDANLGVHGIQFYTLNRFGSVQDVLCELRKLGILKETPPKDACGDA
ncbi:5,10-methylenetetrahydrofolate reductase [Drosophila virilis]|uniref:Uncharacterized protein n=1 Tax=Drosophila virilis TaxID=7244 RepID=B4LC84_DROVI|nr:5,10-methylenetetrahydrofolate reductase [Drosophila virilis]EDW70912.1 uncharacterized protein Dvir_GJ11283 [Drosophila virilis]